MPMVRFIINEWLIKRTSNNTGTVFEIETSHQGNLKGISAGTSPIYPAFQIPNSSELVRGQAFLAKTKLKYGIFILIGWSNLNDKVVWSNAVTHLKVWWGKLVICSAL